MSSLGRDLAAEIHAVFSAASASATAAGAGDNTPVVGAVIDLNSLPTRFESLVYVLTATAALTEDKTLTVTAKVETSDNSNMSDDMDVIPLDTVIVLTGGDSGTTEYGTAKLGISTEYLRRYVRLTFTPDLSASGTDTANVQSVAIFSGAAKLP